MAKKIPKKRKKQITNPLSDARSLYKWIGLLLVVTFIVFSPALRNELVSWDDYNYIRDNPVVHNLTGENLKHIFDFNTFIMGNYHPLTILSYMIEYQISGPSPFLYHLNNILLHLCNIVLFTVLIWLLTRRFYATLIAAALFALHPMRVESVVWAAERKDVLYTMFYLLSVIAYIYYITQTEKRNRNYVLTLVFFLLSVFSKGQAVVLPLTLFLIDFWFGKKIEWKTILNKIPFFALSLIFIWLAPFDGVEQTTALALYMIFVPFIWEGLGTMTTTAYYALLPEMFNTYEDRTKVAVSMNIIQVIGLFIGMAGTPILTDTIGWVPTAAIFAAITIITYYVGLPGMFERESSVKAESIPFFSAI